MAKTRRGLFQSAAAITASGGAVSTAAAANLDAPIRTNSDTDLIQLCAAEIANSQRFRALSEQTASLRFPHPPAVEREFGELVARTWEARETISAIPACTLAGVRAKALAMRADVLSGAMGDELAIADSLVDDLLRLLPAGGVA